jgi:hypothetical protein
MLTQFNKEHIFETQIVPIIEELADMCKEHGIPLSVTMLVGVKGEEIGFSETFDGISPDLAIRLLMQVSTTAHRRLGF